MKYIILVASDKFIPLGEIINDSFTDTGEVIVKCSVRIDDDGCLTTVVLESKADEFEDVLNSLGDFLDDHEDVVYYEIVGEREDDKDSLPES